MWTVHVVGGSWSSSSRHIPVNTSSNVYVLMIWPPFLSRKCIDLFCAVSGETSPHSRGFTSSHERELHRPQCQSQRRLAVAEAAMEIDHEIAGLLIGSLPLAGDDRTGSRRQKARGEAGDALTSRGSTGHTTADGEHDELNSLEIHGGYVCRREATGVFRPVRPQYQQRPLRLPRIEERVSRDVNHRGLRGPADECISSGGGIRQQGGFLVDGCNLPRLVGGKRKTRQTAIQGAIESGISHGEDTRGRGTRLSMRDRGEETGARLNQADPVLDQETAPGCIEQGGKRNLRQKTVGDDGKPVFSR